MSTAFLGLLHRGDKDEAGHKGHETEVLQTA